MGLREQGHPAVLEPLDEVDLPQRAVGVEPARHDPRGQLAELVEGARTRERGAAYVVGEVEVLVVDPDRVGQAARDRGVRAGGSGARTRSGRRCAPAGRRSRSPSRPGRRSRGSRCAWASAASPRPAERGRSRAAARSSCEPLSSSTWASWDSGRGRSHVRTPDPPAGGSDVPFRAPGRRARLCRCWPWRLAGMWLRRLRERLRARRQRRRRRRTPAVRRPSTSPSRATPSTPQGAKVEVKAGDPLKLHITADKPGEIHVHSSPEQEHRVRRRHHRQDAHHRPARRRRRRVAHPRQADLPARGALSAQAAALAGRPSPAPARPRRGQGPAHPARARDGRRASRRWSSPSACWRWPGAHRATRDRGRAGRSRASQRVVDDPRFQWTVRIVGLAVRGLPHLGADLGTRPGHQPGARHVLRAGLGRHRAGLAAVRPGRQGGQPGAHAQPAAGEGHRRRPGDRADDVPRPARATGRPRSGCSRSPGRSWSTRRAPTWARCGSGWRPTSRSC